MKKFLIVFLTSMMILGILPAFGSFSLAADDYYSMACEYGQFEVSYIEDDGTFSKVSCHSGFDEAKKAMKANNDYVVRYAKSYSPSKIVAMNSGLAYSYPGRRNSSIMNLYQDPSQKDSSKYKTTYVANHYEMTYVDTCGSDVYDIAGGGKGYIRIVLNGFEGYTDLEYTDLVPSKFIRKGIPIWLGGRNTYEGEEAFEVRVKQNYFALEKNGNYVDMVFHYFRAYPRSSSDRDCLSYSLSVDNGENYLKAGLTLDTKYYSNDGINFYADPDLKYLAAKVYNYYQFLPLRSKTSISADSFNGFLNNIYSSGTVMKNEGSSFINAQNKYGCNALIVYAMACLESAYGTSWYALNRNNLFGWSAYDDNPGSASSFSSVETCVNEQMGRNLYWFMDYTNTRYFGTAVGNKGAGINVKYASDPYCGMKIAAIAYSIDKYHNGKNGSLSDYNKYALGFVKDNYNDVLYSSDITWDPNVYKAYTGNDVLYTGRFGSHYQKDLTVVLLQEDSNRYKIQSTNPVSGGSIVTDDGVIKYDWNNSVGYIDKQYVVKLNDVDIEKLEPELPHEPISMADSLDLTDGILTISGISLISNINMLDQSKVSHKLHIYDLKDESEVKVIDCDVVDSQGYSINDGFDYKWAGFEAKVDLKEMDKSSYIFRIETSYDGKNAFTTLLKSYNDDISLLTYKDEQRDYSVRLNDFYGYRIECDIDDQLLDHTAISKPSNRSSLITLDEVTYEEGEDSVYAVFEGLGMIYYLNYDQSVNMHELYLVNDETAIKADTVTHACDFDYKSFYDSSYNMDNICYTAKVSLNDLQGRYKLIMKVNNGEYSDVAEITNAYEYNHNTYESEHLKTSFLNDAIRYRLLMDVSHSE